MKLSDDLKEKLKNSFFLFFNFSVLFGLFYLCICASVSKVDPVEVVNVSCPVCGPCVCPNLTVSYSVSSSVVVTSTTSTSTSLCGDVGMLSCDGVCRPGLVENSHNICVVPVQGRSVPSGLRGCGGWAL